MKLSINTKLILAILGFVSMILGVTMFIGFVVSLICEEPKMTGIFLSLTLILTIMGFLVFRYSRKIIITQTIRIREGIIAVTACWFFTAALGTLPYLLAGSHHSFIDAFFESTACITTSGATLIDNLAELPRSLLFWRQLTNWFGGVGIIVFTITIMPLLGFGAANLAGAEMTIQTLEKIQTRVTDTARIIVTFFLALTGAQVLLLLMGGIGIYDSFVIAFCSMGNGGFAIYQIDSVLQGSLYVEVIVSVFCVIASLSFVSYQLLLKGRVRDFFKEAEIRIYLFLLFTVCLLVFLILLKSGVYPTAAETLRYGIFQTVSFVTTAGYSISNVGIWPQAVHWLLIGAMIIGGCSGSTSGGVRVVRAAVVVSIIRRNIYKKLHPNAVVAVRLGDRVIPEERVASISTFFLLYAMIVLISCFVLSFENLDTETTLGTVIAMLSNTGLVIGPGINYGESFGIFSQFSRLYMSVLMITGRLEILTIVLLFSPAFWRANR